MWILMRIKKNICMYALITQEKALKRTENWEVWLPQFSAHKILKLFHIVILNKIAVNTLAILKVSS